MVTFTKGVFLPYKAVIRFYMGRPGDRYGRYIFPDEVVLYDGYTAQMALTEEHWTNVHVDGAIDRGWLVFDPNYQTGIEVSDEGVPISAQIDKMNFVGAGITVTLDPLDSSKVNITVPGGGGISTTYTETTIFQSTGSTIYQQALRLNTGAISAGNYRVGWYYIWSHDDIATDFLARVQLDVGTTIGIHQQEPSDAGGAGPGGTDQRFVTSGFAYRSLTAGAHTVDIEYATSRAGQTSSIYEARIELWQV